MSDGIPVMVITAEGTRPGVMQEDDTIVLQRTALRVDAYDEWGAVTRNYEAISPQELAELATTARPGHSFTVYVQGPTS